MDEPYRPTCAGSSIPSDVIFNIKGEAAALLRAGASVTATAMVDELNGWLLESGQHNSFGVYTNQFAAEILRE